MKLWLNMENNTNRHIFCLHESTFTGKEGDKRKLAKKRRKKKREKRTESNKDREQMISAAMQNKYS